MLIRELRDDELYKSAKLSALAFSYAVNIEEKKMETLKEHTFGAFLDDNETLIAQVVAIDYVSFHNGTPVGAVGIAGVASSPEHRRAGAVRAIFDHLFSIAGEQGWELSYLYPFSYRYYRKFGYERAVRNRTLTVALPALGGIPRNSGAALLESDDSLPELLALYNRFAARYNACFMRRDGKYFPLDPYRTQNYFYLWRDESGEARGYFQARPNGRTLDILELVYLDRASLLGLLGFMRMFEGQFDTVSFRRLEQDSPVELLIDCDRSASFGAYDAAMGRVLDVPACLRRMRAEAGQTLLLRITDDTCPKNTGLYRLAFTDGETVVEKCAEGEADASMTVNAFSLLALAGASEAELDYVDGLTVYGKRPLLVRLFARRPINLFEQF
ncbi:MAG: enhanced intracellular survival protein Eis [Candidatus Woodwardiibium sp.]